MFDEGSETVTILGAGGGVDDDGYPLPGTADVEVPGCIVQLASTDESRELDRTAQLESLRVFAPAGTVIESDRVVRIRGQVYRVVGIPFDWSITRRPVLGAHRPRVEFTVERGEG